jgi:hypothetical protein
MDSILKRKSDHSINVEFFHDILDEHFSEDEVKQQLETALHWGRYAEIFDYDAKTGRLFLPETATEGFNRFPDDGRSVRKNREDAAVCGFVALVSPSGRDPLAHSRCAHVCHRLGDLLRRIGGGTYLVRSADS